MAIRSRVALVTALALCWLLAPAMHVAPVRPAISEPEVSAPTAVRGGTGGPVPTATIASLVGGADAVGPGLAVAAPPAAAPVRWAPAARAAIRPGVLTETDGGGVCTSDFVFTVGVAVYLGQAAHCAGTGPETETDGCTSATLPLGTAVAIDGADGSRRTGTLAYSSWVTMQARHERDPAVCAFNDLALVRIDAADAGTVNPSVPFFGGPTGLATGGLVPGAPAYTYGNSSAGNSPAGNSPAGLGDPSPKVGVGEADVGGGWGHVVYTLRPGIPGDSGGAYLADGGAALGLLATLNPAPVSNGVTDLARALAYASAHGGLGQVRLVAGTEPFTPAPAEVDPKTLATPAGPPLGG